MNLKLTILLLTLNSVSCYFETCDESHFLPAWSSTKIYSYRK